MFGLNKKLGAKNVKDKFQKNAVKTKEETKQQSTIIPDLICKVFIYIFLIIIIIDFCLYIYF